MTDVETSIARVIGNYQAAVLAKDATALLRLYDPAVRVFDAWGVWSYEGADAWQRAVEGWFRSLGDERCKVTFEDVRSAGTRELASLTAIVRYAGVSPAGDELRSMHNRITWLLRMSGHVLRIVHEHTSAPLGFDDSKGMLQRATGS